MGVISKGAEKLKLSLSLDTPWLKLCGPAEFVQQPTGRSRTSRGRGRWGSAFAGLVWINERAAEATVSRPARTSSVTQDGPLTGPA
jgi:hypothetical protein